MSRLEVYRLETSRWPSEAEGLSALTNGGAAPDAPYYVRPDELLDPWGGPYVYAVPGPGGQAYEIRSLGADGRPGGRGADADVTSAIVRADGP